MPRLSRCWIIKQLVHADAVQHWLSFAFILLYVAYACPENCGTCAAQYTKCANVARGRLQRIVLLVQTVTATYQLYAKTKSTRTAVYTYTRRACLVSINHRLQLNFSNPKHLLQETEHISNTSKNPSPTSLTLTRVTFPTTKTQAYSRFPLPV